MNRRRILNSIHTGMARQAATGSGPVLVAKDHSSIERLSISDLEYVAPRLVKPERAVCPVCLGACEIILSDGNPNLPRPCEECHGHGYYTEAL